MDFGEYPGQGMAGYIDSGESEDAFFSSSTFKPGHSK